MFKIFNTSVVRAPGEVVRQVCAKGKQRECMVDSKLKGLAEEKKQTCEKMLPRNVPQEVRERQERKYKEHNISEKTG